MPAIYVTPLSRLAETVDAADASHLVTLVTEGTGVVRPPRIEHGRHLFIGVSDIVDPMDGHILPAVSHVERLVDFVRDWDRSSPLVIHCWAGISRSTAAAYISLCALLPEADEVDLARRLRSAAPSATPNARLVSLADAHLDRSGRMIAAIAGIGRGAEAYEGTPFRLDVA
jgi:predicted protein tyrosine phosphatase